MPIPARSRPRKVQPIAPNRWVAPVLVGSLVLAAMAGAYVASTAHDRNTQAARAEAEATTARARQVADDVARDNAQGRIRDAEEAKAKKQAAILGNLTKAREAAAADRPDEAKRLFGEAARFQPLSPEDRALLESAQARADQLAKTAIATDYVWAKAHLKTDDCAEMERARVAFVNSRAMQPPPTDAERLSAKMAERQLLCFEGSGELEMALSIVKRRPVTLGVSIKNAGLSARHANPNYFTLVTKSGESFSYSSASFEWDKPFPAVELQPGTTASGVVVFGTSSEPERLIYAEMLGERVERRFP